MKTSPGLKFSLAAAGLLAFVRLGIVYRAGAVTGDDVDLLADCFRWWHDGEREALSTIFGSAGIIYSGFHHFLWATLAGLFSFKLAPLFAAHAVLVIIPALVLGWQLRGRPEARWAMLLALSSPLAAYLSESLLPLWWLSQFGGTVALQVAAREDRGRPLGSIGLFLVGTISGYFCTVYPSMSALTLGLFVWLLVGRKPLATHLAYLGGCIAGCLPYLCILATSWDRLNPRMQVGDGEISWLQLFGSLFRHLGIPFEGQRANSHEAWLAWEVRLSAVSPWLWAAAAAVCLAAVVLELRARRRLPATVQLALCTWPGFLLFSAVTHTERAYHQAGNLWWITAVLVPWAIQTLLRHRSTPVLFTLLAFNAASLGLMLGPRLAAGTTADPLNGGRGLGVAWWMQEDIVRQIEARAREELALGVTRPLAVRCDAIYYIQWSLPKLFSLQHPDLKDKVRWVVVGLTQSDLVVTRAAEGRLRLTPFPDQWHRNEQPMRQEIRLSSEQAWDRPVQVSLPLASTAYGSLVLTTTDGTVLPFVTEATERESFVWVRLPALSRGVTSLWAYFGATPGSAAPAASPGEVFDYYDGFDGSLANWKVVGDGRWEIRDGICVVSLPALPPDGSTTQLLLNRPPQAGGLIEARLRLPKFKTPIDAGVVFASRPGDQAHFWNLAGYGVTQLTRIDPDGVPHMLTWTANHWKAKPGTWYVIGAEWKGGEILASADGWTGRRTIVDTINLAESGFGQVGLGAKPGPGTPPAEASIEFDWVRIRTSFLGHPPKVMLGRPESRP